MYRKELSLLFLLSVLLTILSTAAHAANPAVAAGGHHSIALRDDGTLCTWGLNIYGQIGDGTSGENTNKNIPVKINAIDNIVRISGGGYVTMAIKDDGTLWMWGRNNNGQLGNNTTDDLSTPAKVNGISNVKAVAGGGNHTVALKNDGTVWTWGTNRYGQLGNGTNKESLTPINVPNLTNVKAIAANGNYSIALKNDGTLWTWGYNSYGQLGDGTTENRNTPVQVSGLDHVTAIAAGGLHAMAVRNDGTLWAWGDNSKGQVGDGTNETKIKKPVQITGIDNIAAIAGGGSHSLVLKGDGTIYAWGDNSKGQLGNSTNENQNIPVYINDITDVAYISAGSTFSLVLKNDGTVWTWGENFCGQLGNGTSENKNIPVQTKGTEGIGFLKPGIPISHVVNASSGDNGHIEPTGAVSINEGSISVFKMIPDTGYELDTVTADGISVGAVNTYAFSYIYENHTIDVSFKSLPVSLPAVESAPVKDITSSTAISGGEVISDGGATVTARGVCWSNSPFPTTDNVHTDDGTGKGIFTSEITGLTSGTTYYVRAYATNSVGTCYGEEISFFSLCSLPTVTTDEVVSISETAATGGGTVTDDGGSSVTARGLCWSTSQSPILDDAHTEDGTGKGIFTSEITGLTSGTTYYVRAYATNSMGTAYGYDSIFTTLQHTTVPQVITNSAISVTTTTAVLKGTLVNDGGSAITEKGFYWSDKDLTEPQSGNKTVNDSEDFQSLIADLIPGTTYYVKAYATNKEGTAYGDQITFTTQQNYTISGYIKDSADNLGISGVAITFSDNGGSATTDSSGYYTNTVNQNWTGTVTPSLEGYTFNPSNRTYTDITSNQSVQNYTAILTVVYDFDLSDVILVLKVIAGMNPSSDYADADINGDGKIGLEEAVYILQYLSEIR